MTTLLLDTQAMLWFFWDDPKLSADAKDQIEDANNRKLEIVSKPSGTVPIFPSLRGKMGLSPSPRRF